MTNFLTNAIGAARICPRQGKMGHEKRKMHAKHVFQPFRSVVGKCLWSPLYGLVVYLIGTLSFMVLISCAGHEVKHDTIRLHLKSTPPEAEVTASMLGLVGKTDSIVEVQAPQCQRGDDCQSSFYFSKPGYQPVRVTRKLLSRDEYIHAILEPVRTSLEVETHPPFAKVHVTNNGRKVDLSGFNEYDLKLDDEALWHGADTVVLTINVSAPGYKSIQKNITLKRGEQRMESLALLELSAAIDVRSEPEGVDVYERRMGYLGRTPFTLKIPVENLVRVSHRPDQRELSRVQLQLSFKKENYQSLEFVEQVEIGGPETIIDKKLVPVTK
jgi:hypothetical protein